MWISPLTTSSFTSPSLPNFTSSTCWKLACFSWCPGVRSCWPRRVVLPVSKWRCASALYRLSGVVPGNFPVRFKSLPKLAPMPLLWCWKGHTLKGSPTLPKPLGTVQHGSWASGIQPQLLVFSYSSFLWDFSRAGGVLSGLRVGCNGWSCLRHTELCHYQPFWADCSHL